MPVLLDDKIYNRPLAMNNQKNFVLLGAVFALLTVVLGAFGAHALEAPLEARGSVETWKTAVDYQMWHALALLLLVALRIDGRAAKVAGYCFCIGVTLFSGSLYWLALDGPRWLGPITPIGGLLLISGWIALIVATCKTQKLHSTLAPRVSADK
jgi:uncharacterized membrane protein YgdD (TMEM256/DUF423 family)